MKIIPKIASKPQADQSAIIQEETFRITVLTERLFRLEFNQNGCFEDRATQVVLNRDFKKPLFEVINSEDRLEIVTDYLHLHYDKKAFSSVGLGIEIKGADLELSKRWFYHKSAENSANLGGTTRTLDDISGTCPLETGLMSRDGWAVLDDSASLLQKEDGWIEPRSQKGVDLYFFGYYADYTGCLKDYYYLTGKTPMLPRYALGNWWSRYYEYTEESYKVLMERFEQEDIPFSVAVIDMDWHLVDIHPKYGDGWTGFTWNKELFPDPARFLKWLHDRGMRITLNMHPAQGIRASEECYKEAAEAMGMDVEKEEPVEFDMTNPEFMKTYFTYGCHPHEEMGVDFWWIDWQQGTKTKVEGLDSLWMLNHFHFLDSARKNQRPITFSRYSGPGSHRYPIGFSGDTHITWESLDFQPYFTLTASNIGYGWWSHDIGGHTCGYKDDEMECRWYQLGVFSPIMRLHSTKNEFNGKEPWRYRKDVEEVMKNFLRLRHKLIPYLYTMNYRSYQNDEPLIQPLYYKNSWRNVFEQVKNEYYYGTDFLVNPITKKQFPGIHVAKVSTWIPKGTWIDFFTGVIYQSEERTMDLYRTLDSIPVLVKAGAIIPMTCSISKREAEQNPKQLYLRIFAGADGFFSLYEDDNESTGYEKGDCVFTDFTFFWEERRFTIAPCRGNQELIPSERSYRIELNAIAMNGADMDSIRVMRDGQGAEILHSYDSRSGKLVIEIPKVNKLETVTVTLPKTCSLRQNPIAELVFDFLDQAEMDFNLKTQIYELVRNTDSKLHLLSQLQGMNLEQELLGVLVEFITARLS